MTRQAVGLFILLVAAGHTAAAQLIQIKTVPLAQSDQFTLFPSVNLGMGGVSIALPDTMSDPAVNPALGARLGVARFTSQPITSNLSFDAGGGRALPVGAFGKFGSWFGGVSLAAQMLDAGGSSNQPVPLLVDSRVAIVPQTSPTPRSHSNAFAFGMLGKSWPGSGLSVGGSVFWARLTGVDGVDLLYAGSQNIKQLGHAADFRLGVLKQWANTQSLEALVLHDRFRMAHDVTFLDFAWDPATQQVTGSQRVEQNKDYTDTWGLHLAYQRPLSDAGWRIGWIITGNRMFHPEIPNYEVQNAGIRNIPWDPGDSYAYNFGVGLGRAVGLARFGVEAVYEPIWSHTWGEADAPLPTRTGDTIPTGGMTVENYFAFSNVMFRIGTSHELVLSSPDGAAGIQLGLAVRSIAYHLAQFDHVQVAARDANEQWTEWTPTWGLSLRFPDLEIRYQGRTTNGVGRPGVFFAQPRAGADVLATASSNVLATPTGPLDLTPMSVVTHQVSIAIPLGRAPAAGGVR